MAVDEYFDFLVKVLGVLFVISFFYVFCFDVVLKSRVIVFLIISFVKIWVFLVF